MPILDGLPNASSLFDPPGSQTDIGSQERAWGDGIFNRRQKPIENDGLELAATVFSLRSLSFAQDRSGTGVGQLKQIASHSPQPHGLIQQQLPKRKPRQVPGPENADSDSRPKRRDKKGMDAAGEQSLSGDREVAQLLIYLKDDFKAQFI
jgi:hypothetical protein